MKKRKTIFSDVFKNFKKRLIIFIISGILIILAIFLFIKNLNKNIPPLILLPTDDTFVSEKRINQNWGKENVLLSDFENKVFLSFIKFDIPPLKKQPKAVILNLTVAEFQDASSSESGTLRNLTNNEWDEENLTWDNKPAVDGEYSWKISDEKVSFGKSYSINLTNYIKSPGTYSFAITTNNEDAVIYNSKEASWGKPTLAIYFSPLPEKTKMAIYPFIKNTSFDSAVITWATAKKSKQELAFGKSSNNLENKVKPTITHLSKEKTRLEIDLFIYEAHLKNLYPQTTYFYKIMENKINLTPEKNLQFTTPLLPEINNTLTVAVIGDYGSETPEKIQNFYQIKNINPNFILTTGDNSSPDGSFSTWKNKIFNYLNESLLSGIVFHPTPGNHDLDTPVPRQNFDGWITPYEVLLGDPETPGVLYNSFDYGYAHFIILDSSNFESEKMFSWFKQDLENNKNSNKWAIVLWHHPFYSCSPTRETDKKIEKLSLPYIKLLSENGGGILLNGHHHFYCRSKKITIINEPDLSSQLVDDVAVSSLKRNDINYFSFSPGSIISFVTGGGSDELSKIKSNLWPAEIGLEKSHILKMTIDKCQIRTNGVTNEGETFDETVIEKCSY